MSYLYKGKYIHKNKTKIRFLENILKRKELESMCRNLKVTYHCIPSKCFNFSLYTYICTFGTQVYKCTLLLYKRFFFVSALNAEEN